MPTPKGSVPWNAGTGKGWTDKRGYRWVYVVENGKRRAKREHRHVMEQHLGRELRPEEIVHHRNENPSDNRIENLAVEGWAEHTAHHSNGRRQSEYAKRTQSVIAEYREANKRLRCLNAEMLAALRKADEFITNGIALGYIRMPDRDTPDTAHKTPSLIRTAIRRAESRPASDDGGERG